MGSTTKNPQIVNSDEEESFLFAMQLASASVLPMLLKSAIELDLLELELIKKAGAGAFISPADLAVQLPTAIAAAPVMLDRILCLLTTYAILECRLYGAERLYGLGQF